MMFRMLTLVAFLYLATYAYGQGFEGVSIDTPDNSGDIQIADASVVLSISTSTECPVEVAEFLSNNARFQGQSCTSSTRVSLLGCRGEKNSYYHRPIQYRILLLPVDSQHICCWLCRLIPSCGFWTWVPYTRNCDLYERGRPFTNQRTRAYGGRR
eukprot:g414.t1